MLQSRMTFQPPIVESDSDIRYEMATHRQNQTGCLELYPECQQLSRTRGDSPHKTAVEVTPPHLLLVDDDQQESHRLAELLTQLGYHVDVVHEGRAALESIKQTEYQLAVMEFSLPDMDGIELYDRIRQHRNRREVQAVILTSAADTETARIARLRGVEGVLPKPLDPVRLIHQVQKLTA